MPFSSIYPTKVSTLGRYVRPQTSLRNFLAGFYYGKK